MNLLDRAWPHMRGLWPRWTLLPAAPFVLWGIYAFFVRGEHRWELLLVMLLAPGLAYGNARTKELLVGIYPLGLIGLLYDSMRFFKNAGITAADVHTCDLHDLDARLFGFTSAGGTRVSWSDWFVVHHWTPVDLYCAIPYGTFLFAAIGYAVYLYLEDREALTRFAWTFLVVNVMGFTTYHLYPAAPPWWVHANGCTADLSAHASEGARLAHVDAILGFKYFAGFYGRSNDVFGAFPSLHVGYPAAILLEAWRRHGPLGKGLSLLFLVSMMFSAVYLDHHWVIDVVAGLVYTLVAYGIVYFVRARVRTRGAFAPPLDAPQSDARRAEAEAE